MESAILQLDTLSDANGIMQGSPLNPLRERERELQRNLKRMRGEAACAECRRLKAKCDRKIPCSSCVRRKCPNICPNGSLLTEQGPRLELANAEKLNIKLKEMSKRIRQLEDALKIAHSTVSSAPHPVLAEELLAINSGVDTLDEAANPLQESDVFASFGTLSIKEGGETRFIGRSGSEGLMMSNEDIISRPLSNSFRSLDLPEEIIHLIETFPFNSGFTPKKSLREKLLSYLPSKERAVALTESYIKIIAFYHRPVEREQIMEELIPRFYDNYCPFDNSSSDKARLEQDIPEHELALLFMVLACGVVAYEDSLLPSSDEAELYKHLACAALGMNSVFHGTCLASVQAVSLLGAYDFFSCRKNTYDMPWKMQSFALCLASSIGLHRDPSCWNFPEKLARRRRLLFWELWALDNVKSIATGRPALFHTQDVDCDYPEDTEAQVSEDGKHIMGFLHWKHTFGKEVASHVVEQLCTVRPIKYSEILDLDKRIREHVPYPSNNLYSHGAHLERAHHVIFALHKEIALLFIHRSFFVRAMRESPDNPLRSPFAPSFLISYASAIIFLRVLRREFECPLRPSLRHWPLWMMAFAAGIVVGTVAVRGMNLELMTRAFRELELAIGMFEKAQMHPVVNNGLPTLHRLRDKARAQAQAGTSAGSLSPGTSTPSSIDSMSDIKLEDVEDELGILSAVTSSSAERRPTPSQFESPRYRMAASTTRTAPIAGPSKDRWTPLLFTNDAVSSAERPEPALYHVPSVAIDSPSESTPNLLEWLSIHDSSSKRARASRQNTFDRFASGQALQRFFRNFDTPFINGEAALTASSDALSWGSNIEDYFQGLGLEHGPEEVALPSDSIIIGSVQTVVEGLFYPSLLDTTPSTSAAPGPIAHSSKDSVVNSESSSSSMYDPFTSDGDANDVLMDAEDDAALADAWLAVMDDSHPPSLGIGVMKEFGLHC